MDHPEKGQAFAQYVQSRPNQPGAQGRAKIYLQPIGKFAAGGVGVEAIRSYLEAFFMPLLVDVLPPLDSENLMVRHRKNSISGQLQWNCTDLLDELERRVPIDAYIVMGITETDLYPADNWNFVFGMARLKNRVGVFSLARYNSGDSRQKLIRALRVVSHETGHAFGMAHCIHFRCLMNGVNHQTEADKVPLSLCPVCLRKLHYATKFDPVERYFRLEKWCESFELKQNAKWFGRRHSAVSSAK